MAEKDWEHLGLYLMQIECKPFGMDHLLEPEVRYTWQNGYILPKKYGQIID